MAVLTTEQRQQVYGDLMSDMSSRRAELDGLLKNDIKAAGVAIDDNLDGAFATLDAEIPEPARSGLMLRQKMNLLRRIIDKRMEVL